MAKKEGKTTTWWLNHKKKIWNDLQKLMTEQKNEFDQRCKGRGWSWELQQKRKTKIDFARLYQQTKSSAELMHEHQNRNSFMFTITIAPPHRVEDGDESFDGTMKTIQQQAESLLYHMRTLSKSEVFKSNGSKECAYKKRLHYEWALELQAGGDVHLHAIISLPDDVQEVIRFIELIHGIRNRHLDITDTRRDKKEGQSILPLGRTHLSLLDTMQMPILKYFAMKGTPHKMMPDQKDGKKNYFFPKLSPEINILDGNGTLLEFTSLDDMLKKHKRLQKYIQDLAKLKFRLKAILVGLAVNVKRHNLKGKFKDPKEKDIQAKRKIQEAVEDIAVFEYLKIRMHASSQMTFPSSLYQKMRKQLINHSARYESLVEVTLDWCKGALTIEGKVPDRTINVYGDIIATEPKRTKKTKIQVDNILLEGINDYQLAKEGM